METLRLLPVAHVPLQWSLTFQKAHTPPSGTDIFSGGRPCSVQKFATRWRLFFLYRHDVHEQDSPPENRPANPPHLAHWKAAPFHKPVSFHLPMPFGSVPAPG